MFRHSPAVQVRQEEAWPCHTWDFRTPSSAVQVPRILESNPEAYWRQVLTEQTPCAGRPPVPRRVRIVASTFCTPLCFLDSEDSKGSNSWDSWDSRNSYSWNCRESWHCERPRQGWRPSSALRLYVPAAYFLKRIHHDLQNGHVSGVVVVAHQVCRRMPQRTSLGT